MELINFAQIKDMDKLIEKIENLEQNQNSNTTTKTFDFELQANSWDENGSIEIINESIHEKSIVLLSLRTGLTREQLKAYSLAELYCSSQSEGRISFSCYGKIPTCDIPITIVVL